MSFNLSESTASNYKSTSTSDSQDYEKLFQYWEGLLITVILGFLCVFGLVANGITFFAICCSKTLRSSPFNIIIMSLCVSDFLSALNSPLQTYRRVWGYLEFELPLGFCKFTQGLNQWTLFVTVQHIVLFSIFRLWALQFQYKIKRFTTKIAIIVAASVWIAVFLIVALFYLITSTVVPYRPGRMKTACTAVAKEWRPVASKYTAYVVPILMFVPFFIIVVSAVLILIKLFQLRRRRTALQGAINNSRHEQEKVAVIQVTLIVFSFLMGYSVETAYRMTKALDLRDLFTVRTKWLTVTIAYILLRASECLNPLFYNLASSQIRSGTKKFLRIKKGENSSNSTESKDSNKNQCNGEKSKVSVV